MLKPGDVVTRGEATPYGLGVVLYRVAEDYVQVFWYGTGEQIAFAGPDLLKTGKTIQIPTQQDARASGKSVYLALDEQLLAVANELAATKEPPQ